jgi:hypothetical protein
MACQWCLEEDWRKPDKNCFKESEYPSEVAQVGLGAGLSISMLHVCDDPILPSIQELVT